VHRKRPIACFAVSVRRTVTEVTSSIPERARMAAACRFEKPLPTDSSYAILNKYAGAVRNGMWGGAAVSPGSGSELTEVGISRRLLWIGGDDYSLQDITMVNKRGGS
jgi:hypothetical protein